MSDCEKFIKISEKIINGECSKEEKLLFDAHTKECSACKEELAFALNIQSTLHSLPKIEVPDNFLMSLNEKLDLEDKIKKQAPRIIKKSFFTEWKKYSALSACLLLAVLVKIDVWNIPDTLKSDGVISQTVDVISVPEQTDTAAQIQLPVENADKEVVQSVQQMPIPQKNEVKSKKTSAPEKKPKAVKVTTTISNPVEEQHQPEPAVQEKIIVVNPSTPHSSVELPDYMDNKDNIVYVNSADVQAKKVSLDDFEVVATDKMLEAFSLAEMPSNKAIVASPAAMDSVQNISIDLNSGKPANVSNHGAGSGTLFVSVNDQTKVEDILTKYFSHAEDKMFMLTSKNYNSFINELKIEGIEYHDYMISTESTNVAFKLMVS